MISIRTSPKPTTTPVPLAPEPSAPKRIQLSRKRGWKMPPNTVKVDRTTRWGNPFAVGCYVRISDERGPVGLPIKVTTAEFSVIMFREVAMFHRPDLSALRGKNLACWCKPGDPCHADVLLELANAPLAPEHDAP